MKPGPTVELRRPNPSLFMLLKVEWTLGGTTKSWAELEQAELVYPERNELLQHMPTMPYLVARHVI